MESSKLNGHVISWSTAKAMKNLHSNTNKKKTIVKETA